MKNLLLVLLVGAVALMAFNLKPPAAFYRQAFSGIDLGDLRTEVIQALGAPSGSCTLELPLLGRAERLEWRALPLLSTSYSIFFYQDRVVAKQVKE